MTFRRWEIIESETFRTQLLDLNLDDPVRADDFLDPILDILARHPYYGREIYPGSILRKLNTRTETWARMVAVTVFYAVIDETYYYKKDVSDTGERYVLLAGIRLRR